jgi:hypothetical protein
MIALKPMVSRTGELLWANNVVATSTLLENLLKKRDILTLKERHLALITSYIIGVLGPAETLSKAESC